MSLSGLRKLSLLLLFATAIFEPSDRVFGLKVPLFAAFILLGAVAFIVNEETAKPGLAQLLYVLAIALVLPMWGLLVSFVLNPGVLGSDGLQYLKSHLFITFSIFLTPIAMLRFAERAFMALLVVLAHLIIGMFLLTLVLPAPLYGAMLLFGRETNLFLLGSRQYGGITFPTTYYVTAPLLVFGLAYHLQRSGEKRSAGTVYLVAVSMLALFLSGTRNNILMSLLIPAYYSVHQRRGRLLLVVLLPLIIYMGADVLRSMFDPHDVSNAAKVAYLSDYWAIFSNPKNLLLGQGLGTRFFTSGLGEVVSITELSYFEIVRTYGIVVGLLFMFALVYPLVRLFRSRDPRFYFTVGYAAYLVGNYSDPYLLSSNGMLVLGLAAALAFEHKRLPAARAV